MSMRKIILPLLLMFAAPVYGADICQQSFTFRLEKGSALTHQEGDDNFRNSKDVCDWLDGVSTCSISGEFLTGFDSDGDAVCAAPATVVNITGNAGTATALAANPANCSTGNAPLGVAASGAAEGCFDVATQGELDAIDTSDDNLTDNTLNDLSNVSETGEGAGIPLVGDGAGGWAPAAATGCLSNGTNCPADDTGTDDQTAAEVPYTPADGADWTNPDPTTAAGGLDVLADRLTTEEAKPTDFGAAADLEANGSLSADVVAPAEMADADHGDVSWSGGVASVDPGAVGLGELADDVSCTGSQDVRRNAGDTGWECYTPSGSGIGGSTGSTDNRVLRADGTGGATVQGSKLAIADDGSVTTAAVPTDFGTPVIWLDASQDDTNLNDGDAVATATNYGSGGNLTQGTAGAKPTFKTSIINGLPVYRFDGGDCLTNASVTLSTLSVFVVFKATADGLLYEHSADVGSNNGSFFYTSQASTSRVKRGGTDSARDIGASWGSRGEWLIALQSYGGTFATQRVMVNGAWMVNTTTGTVSDPGTGSVTTEMNIGCRNETTAYVTGDIAEFLVFSPRLTTAQERAVTLYLQNKFNL